jgi:Ni/Co efflux regulator RcnB
MNVKHLSIATFAAALLMSATAFAADRHEGGAPHGGGGAPHAAPHAGGGGMPHGGGGFSHGGGMASHAAAPSFNRASFSEQRSGFSSYSRDTEVHRSAATFRSNSRGGMEAPRGSVAATMHNRGAYGGMEHSDRAAVSGGPQHYARDPHGYGARPGNWNNRPRNFDRGSYQHNVSASARFHYGSYNRPSGWYYRRWSYGDTLPRAFWARDYWLTSWWMFDLAIPPNGYEWVRYGDDALLINVYNGQILQVDYGVFY